MESNSCRSNVSSDGVWCCYCKRFEEAKENSCNQSVDKMQVPCMKSSKNGPEVSNQPSFNSHSPKNAFSLLFERFLFLLIFTPQPQI